MSLNDKLLASKHSKQSLPSKTSPSQDNPTSNDINNTHPASISPTNSSQVKSFAETTANTVTPKMSQAIVMNSLDGIKQIQYIIALSKITDANNIISASCISYNRFCVFLRNQQITNDIINKHSSIFIDNIEIPIRKLINPAKRIILLNVYPAISNNLITDAPGTLGVKIAPAISPLKAGFPLNQFAHITSFRRQLYINPDDFAKLPGSIVIALDNTSYRIFITDDTVTCFLCKKTGHVSSSCNTTFTAFPMSEDTVTSNVQTITNTSSHHIVEKTNSLNVTSGPPLDNTAHLTVDKTHNTNEMPLKNIDQITQEDKHADISDPEEHQAIFKRPAPESTCPSAPPSPTLTSHIPEIEMEVTAVKNDNSNKHTTKKPKVRSRSNSSTRTTDKLGDLLEPATALLQNNDSPIDLISFKYILENFSNKNLNIHDLCISIGSKATDVLDMA